MNEKTRLKDTLLFKSVIHRQIHLECMLFVRCVSSLFMKKQTQETHCCLIGRDGFDMEMEERGGMGCVIDENERMRR